MAANRQTATPRRRPVTSVAYTPPGNYALDVELYPARELQRRAGDVALRGFERIDYHCLIYLTSGRYVHVVDLAMVDCARGSLIVLQPGQVHRFGDLSAWDGWLMVFRSELLPSQPRTGKAVEEIKMMQHLHSLPTHLALAPATQQAVSETFRRMADDARRPATAALNALLRSQVEALVIRLHMDGPTASTDDAIQPALVQRFQRYRALIEREFANWHDVQHYARHLGCSAKSLTRAVQVVADRNAKSVLTDRIVLEAKRLLAHSVLSVASVGDRLGFSEATNFVKFFRRETRLTPSAFRAQLRGSKDSPARALTQVPASAIHSIQNAVGGIGHGR